ncbi:MAG TPA: O-methyltransferase [Candidatus Acidoferrales bacterium]|jgi:predicted O-methyltransferase YrrM|nr:O-methyltransferase [Candidatus Acidoferrales bacterium]
MTQELWTAVDQYINETLISGDPILEAALQASETAGLPPIQVSPPQGKMLHILARSIKARNILEIGTLGGYSTIWMARALPAGGRLLTLEADAKHAEVARANVARAGLAEMVELRLGPALDTLPYVAAENRVAFDLIFIDANKSTMAEYFDWSLKLSRPGTMLIADNVIRSGAVVDAASKDADVQGVRRFNERVAAEPRVSATEIQTVGSKGYDGFALVLVLANS